LKLYPKDQISQ